MVVIYNENGYNDEIFGVAMILKRNIEDQLKAWSLSKTRKPLLVRGARQVGKSSIIENFGKTYFEQIIVINFELSPRYKKCFQSLDPKDICDTIAILSQQKIIPGKTLLFFDEIQDCPEAIQSLRYFKEKMPELHVIGAGSLLELVLNQADYRMPVGRVSFLYLYPLSFKEFLWAQDPNVVPFIERATLKQPLPEAIHDHLIQHLKLYFWLGGMPEVLSAYKTEPELIEMQSVQNSIIATYEKDFGYYHAVAPVKYLQQCFRQLPLLIGQQIKYNKIDPDTRSRELKEALQALEAANIAHRIHATSAQGMPLDATINEKKFKLNFIDVGLIKRMNQLDASFLLKENIALLNEGPLAEQFVGQELLAYAPASHKTKLYFWARDGQGTAEVDYLYQHQNQIFPVEVKAGKIGKLRSLYQYLHEHNCHFRIRISMNPLQYEKGVLSVPLYMISELSRILDESSHLLV